MTFDEYELAKSVIEETLQEAMEEDDNIASVWRAMKEILDNNEEELAASCVTDDEEE